MNPATADLVKAVESVASDQVVILPNNKNIRPVADQVDALAGKTVRVVATGSIVEGFAALLAYDPAAEADANVASMSESAARVVPAEVTRAVRDTVTDAGEVHEGDFIGVSRDGVVAVSDNIVVCTRLLLSRLLEPTHELVTLIEGEGARVGDTRRIEEWLSEEYPDVALEVHQGGQPSTRTCWGLSNGRTLSDLSLREVSVLASVSERKAGGWRARRRDGARPLTTYPRRYIDRTRQADVSGLAGGRRGGRAGHGADGDAARSRQGRAVVDVVVRDDTGRLKIVFFNQPWRAKQLEPGTEAIFFGKVTEYKGARQLTNPVVDVVAGVTPGRRTLRILPVYPASAKVGLTSWEIGEFVTEALERAGEFADPLPDEWRDSIDLWDRTDAFRAIHAPESLQVVDPARRRLVFDELFRLQLALVLRRRAFEDNARALHHAVSPARSPAGWATPWWRGSWPACPTT